MATTTLCLNYDKQEGIVPCVGCKRIFCVKHFQIHRQNLSVELEDVVTRRNTLQEHYHNTIAQTFDPTKLDAWNTVDEWEQEMKEQVRKTADDVRRQLNMYTNQSRSQVEQELNHITENLQQKMERENFIEEDIEKLNHQIDQVEEKMKDNKYHPQVEIISEPIDWNASVRVKLLIENEPKIEKPVTPLVLPPAVTSKPKYPPSIQRKCYTCGTDTWQKECKCCNNTFCGWHLKKHSIESKKH
jgi:hypothetical protein